MFGTGSWVDTKKTSLLHITLNMCVLLMSKKVFSHSHSAIISVVFSLDLCACVLW